MSNNFIQPKLNGQSCTQNSDCLSKHRKQL